MQMSQGSHEAPRPITSWEIDHRPPTSPSSLWAGEMKRPSGVSILPPLTQAACVPLNGAKHLGT